VVTLAQSAPARTRATDRSPPLVRHRQCQDPRSISRDAAQRRHERRGRVTELSPRPSGMFWATVIADVAYLGRAPTGRVGEWIRPARCSFQVSARSLLLTLRAAREPPWATPSRRRCPRPGPNLLLPGSMARAHPTVTSAEHPNSTPSCMTPGWPPLPPHPLRRRNLAVDDKPGAGIGNGLRHRHLGRRHCRAAVWAPLMQPYTRRSSARGQGA
jgi:hypothetical protein